jgi:hypothetical protein
MREAWLGDGKLRSPKARHVSQKIHNKPEGAKRFVL